MLPIEPADLISPGGPSGPVWVMLLYMIIKGWFDERRGKREREEQRQAATEAAEEARKAAEKADQTVTNTKNISNGFARAVNNKLDSIMYRLDDHMAWHEQEKRNGNQPAEPDQHDPGDGGQVDVAPRRE